MKTKLTKTEATQAAGLLLLAKTHNAALKEIEESLAAMLDVPPELGGDYYGHVSDAVYSDYSVRKLLDQLKAQQDRERALAKKAATR